MRSTKFITVIVVLAQYFLTFEIASADLVIRGLTTEEESGTGEKIDELPPSSSSNNKKITRKVITGNFEGSGIVVSSNFQGARSDRLRLDLVGKNDYSVTGLYAFLDPAEDAWVEFDVVGIYNKHGEFHLVKTTSVEPGTFQGTVQGNVVQFVQTQPGVENVVVSGELVRQV